MADDHELRASCAREFGRIGAELSAHEIFRREVRADLIGIKNDVADIKTMFKEHFVGSKMHTRRIDDLKEAVAKVNERQWTERIKTVWRNRGHYGCCMGHYRIL